MEPPFQGEPKMYLRTLKAEKQAACLKCKSNLPTLTVRGLKPEGRHSLEVYACYTIDLIRLTRAPTLAANSNYLRGRSAQLQLL